MVCKTLIDRFSSCLVIFCSVIIFAQSDVPRPRGVSLSKASLYSPTKDFSCFDGSTTIPFSYVNDDYCDCIDGSDEPGTAACINGVFHCTNAGHRPQNLPSSRVNDGVCDCCDGTDEYDDPTTCSNMCEELGQEARAEAQRVAELYKAGSQLRLDLIEKGNKKRNEMAEQLSQLEKDKSEAEKIKAEKELLKNDLETKEDEVLKVYREAEELEKQKKLEQEQETNLRESMEHFNRFDSNHDGELSVDEIKVVNVFDRNKDGEVDDDEVKMFLGESEKVDKDGFVATTWPVLKPLLMMEQGMFKPEDAKAESEGTEPEHEDNHEELDADFEGNDEDNSDLDLQEDHEEEEHVSDQSKVYDDETQRIVDEATDARRQYTDAERTVREIESNVRNIKQNLEKDYGLEQEYTTLDGECFEYEDKEYVYKLCMFQKVTQKSKNGGMEVGLGNWGEWAGPENNKYSVMKYTNGIACWNGPSRTTTVNINCDLETKITSVTEPYRCEYKMEFSTPAACDDSSTSQEHASHDEL